MRTSGDYTTRTNRLPAEMRDDVTLWKQAKYPTVAIGRYADAADQIEILQTALREARLFIYPLTINRSYPRYSERFAIGEQADKVLRVVDQALLGRRTSAVKAA